LALGINDGGLRVAHMMCGYKGGSFEMWSQMCSESASTAARAGSLGCMQWWEWVERAVMPAEIVQVSKRMALWVTRSGVSFSRCLWCRSGGEKWLK